MTTIMCSSMCVYFIRASDKKECWNRLATLLERKLALPLPFNCIEDHESSFVCRRS